MLGCALASKFSCVYLLGLLPLIGLIALPFGLRSMIRAVAISPFIGAIVVLACYAPEWRTPFQTFFSGVSMIFEHNRSGHVSYLLGQISDTGWWYCFPVAFLVKSPLALLSILPAGCWTPVRKRTIAMIGLALGIIFFFGLAMMSRVNLGLRHILPIYPMIFALVAAGLFVTPLTNFRRALMAWAIGLQLFEFTNIHRNYLAFFNLAAGGPESGPRYLLDSNIDWGQDVKKLHTWIRAHNLRHVCISYFGLANFNYYGVGAHYLPKTGEVEKRAAFDCVAAASVTSLYGLYVPSGSYDWLRELRPTAKIGCSIYVYDLRKTK